MSEIREKRYKSVEGAVKGPGKEAGAKRDTFTDKRTVIWLIDVGGGVD